MKLGQKKLNTGAVNAPTAKFTTPLLYSKTYFGVSQERISSYCLDISANQMQESFKLFEDMPSVHEWPISKLIQRELDKHRASMISRDYLLSDGYLKYFPPLTAVLIPTGQDNMPEDSFLKPYDGEFDAVKKYFSNCDEANAQLVSEDSIVAGGIYNVFDDSDRSQGFLFWDERHVNAVIIDGQHRYKALIEAMNENKDFLDCRLIVNLIDLVEVCKRVNKGPTAVARDLFVSINNTPVEVDEARLVLMDDRDALATFTQVLVDDSDKKLQPAIPPELIDWKCDQGKHDILSAVSGVLTLRGVVGAAMFENRSIASVDARSDRKNVQKWLNSLSQWVKPDESIEASLGHDETLAHRFEVACASSLDDDEECQPFLFSYSAAAAAVIKDRFRELYLPVFRKVYTCATPFSSVNGIALKHGVFEKKKPLHRFLRAFSAQRAELLRDDNELKKSVTAYKSDLRAFSENHLLLTVMGQKALFKSLFDLYLSDSSIAADELLKHTESFVERFNEIYDLVNKSKAVDECLFSTRARIKKGVEVGNAGDLGRELWRGIVLGYNGEIDYGTTAIYLLKQTIIDLLSFEEGADFAFSERDKIVNRHVSILQRHNSEIDDEEAILIAGRIVLAKEGHIKKLLTE